MSTADFTLHRMSFMRNSFRPYAYVSLGESPAGGTLVKVTLSAAKSVQVFFIVWFGFLLFWTLVASTAIFRQGTSALILPISFGLGMATFGVVLNAVGRTMALRDAAFLLDFLRGQLRLQQQPPWATPIA